MSEFYKEKSEKAETVSSGRLLYNCINRMEKERKRIVILHQCFKIFLSRLRRGRSPAKGRSCMSYFQGKIESKNQVAMGTKNVFMRSNRLVVHDCSGEGNMLRIRIRLLLR